MRSELCRASRPSLPRHLTTVVRTLVATAALLALLAPAGAADDDGDLEWSVLMPLAPRSLLLDVAVAGGRLVAVGERGHVLVSDDDGGTWTQVRVPTRSTLTGVFFLDRERGWAVGHDAVILRTADGGQTWERVHWAPEEETPLFDVWFADPMTGFALGAYGSFYVTEDGGASWEYLPIADDDFHLHRLQRGDGGALFLAAEAGMIYRSDDDGESWEELPSPYEGSFFGVLPIADEVLLAFGLRGNLFRSEDGGASWSQIDTGTTAMLTDGVLAADGTVIVVGLAGTVLHSEDGGRIFAATVPEDRRGIAAVVEGAPGSLTMVGEFGVRTVPIADVRPPGRSDATAEGGTAR